MADENESPRDFPRVWHPNQTFVDAYNESRNLIEQCWVDDARTGQKVYAAPGSTLLDQTNAIFSSFLLVYANGKYNPAASLDALYARQASGAIRSQYDLAADAPVFSPENPEGLGLPLFAWAEYNLYHKAHREDGSAKHEERIKKVLPILDRYGAWIDASFMRMNGLYETPGAATGVSDETRRKTIAYHVDFNCAMAIHALYMSALADIPNERELSARYRQRYYRLKERIQTLMWDNTHGGFCDIDEDRKSSFPNTEGSFWTLLAEIAESDQAARIADGTPESDYREPHQCFVFIKGLERYQRFVLARDTAAHYLSVAILEPERKWKTLLSVPNPADCPFARPLCIPLMLENVIGLQISLPKKTVDWTIPNMEIMGVENLSLIKNQITLKSNRAERGWEIHMESEKLYYFTINKLGSKKKALPIPSGKYILLLDRI